MKMATASWLAAVVAVLLFFLEATLVVSDTCTMFQIHTTIQGLDAAISSDKCADYASGSTLFVPCDAKDCLSALENVISKLPNCTLSASDNGGTSENKQELLQSGLDECSTDSSSTLTVEAVVTSTSSTATSSVSPTGEVCSGSEASTIADLYLEVVDSTACEEFVTTDDTGSAYISTSCSDTQCMAAIKVMTEQLPDCYTDGVNLKDELVQALASCSLVSPSSSSSTSNECTSSEVSSLAHLTNTIVTSTECEQYVIATSSEWHIAVPCDATECLAMLEDVVQQIPDCELEGTNYKEELSLQRRSCLGASGSSGESSGSGDQANSLRTTAPDSSTNATDSSASIAIGMGSVDLVARVLFLAVVLLTVVD